MKMLHLYKTLAFSALAPLFCLSAFASTVEISNENDKELYITIQAIVAPSEKPSQKEMAIPANKTVIITVTKDDLGGKDIYFIKGKTSTFTFKGECKDMNVNNDYTVTFKENLTVGTDCLCELKK